MSVVEKIQSEIEHLSDDEMSTLRAWWVERDAAAWDKQIEEDLASGRLDHVLAEVEAEIDAGRFTKL